MNDMTDLREAALAATPGPWHIESNGEWLDDDPRAGVNTYKVIGPDYIEVDDGYYIREHDATYIAAASPDRILAVLDANERQAARIAELEAALLFLTQWAEDVSHKYGMMRTEPPGTSTRLLKDAIVKARAALAPGTGGAES